MEEKVEREKIRIDNKSGLIVVDVQKDFTPGGALAVPEGDKIIPTINKYIEEFKKAGGKVFATRDWHPENHISFKERGGPWPPHCVQNTEGAEFHPDLKLPEDVEVVSKAYEPDKDAYSGFEGTDLEERLRRYGVERVFVCGLATDYCVKNTVLDAVSGGFETFLLTDAIKGIDANPGDSERAIEEMKQKGAKLLNLDDLERVGVKEELEKKIEEIKGVAEEKAGEISAQVAQKVEEAKKRIKRVVEREKRELRRSIKRATKEARKAVRKTAKELRKTAKKAEREIKGKVRKAVQSVAKVVSEAASRLKVGKVKLQKKRLQKKPQKVAKEGKKEKKKVLPGRSISRAIKKGKGGGKAMATKKTAKPKAKKPAKKSAAKKK
jgi:nicotinamidase-related amidase/vacuolar-type H+-ATPase subunit E/Vma4